jgi:hypothetical protein
MALADVLRLKLRNQALRGALDSPSHIVRILQEAGLCGFGVFSRNVRHALAASIRSLCLFRALAWRGRRFLRAFPSPVHEAAFNSEWILFLLFFILFKDTLGVFAWISGNRILFFSCRRVKDSRSSLRVIWSGFLPRGLLARGMYPGHGQGDGMRFRLWRTIILKRLAALRIHARLSCPVLPIVFKGRLRLARKRNKLDFPVLPKVFGGRLRLARRRNRLICQVLIKAF